MFWIQNKCIKKKTRCSLRSFLGSSELFVLQCWRFKRLENRSRLRTDQGTELLQELKLKQETRTPDAGIEPTSLTGFGWNCKREQKGGLLTLEFKSCLQLVVTSLQGLGGATILLLVTNSRLTCSVYIQRSRRTTSVLTSPRYWARLIIQQG